MTERLYYDQPYLTSFDATAEETIEKDGAWHVRLDQSAFYPTSGGQPYDLGKLNESNVQDVYVDKAQDVWHVVDSEIKAGERVHGEIDWQRRFDHMQQHAADHMIAGALFNLLGGVTIGLHLSEETSTIDVAMPDGVTRISPEDIQRIELYVNERIQKNVPIRCWFTNEEELKTLPLRKAPTVTEHVRIVAIGDDEMVACGGTHPRSAGEVGLVKILNVSPARGKMRVCFVAGMRAFKDYQLKNDCATTVANMLSTATDKVVTIVGSMQEQLKNAEQELNHLRKKILLDRSTEMIANAIPVGEAVSLVAETVEGDMGILREVASRLIENPGVVVLFGTDSGDKSVFVFARSADVSIHMGQLLGAAAKPLGGKGGGKPDFAQGGGPAGILLNAKNMLINGEFK